MNCRHCKLPKNLVGRGLCYRCYQDVRDQYAPLRDCFAQERPDGNYHLPCPSEPTDAPPGSAEKMRVLALRVKNGESLWHPADRKYDENDEGWSFPPPSPGDLGGDLDHVPEMPAGVGGVDLSDDFSGVAELVGGLLESGPALDCGAGVAVSEAVPCHVRDEIVVQADPLCRPAKVSGKRISIPGPSIGVRKDEVRRGALLEPRQIAGHRRAEGNNPGLAGLSHRLVMLKTNVWVIAENNIVEGHLAHLASSGSRSPHEQQSLSQSNRSSQHQGSVFVWQGRSAGRCGLALQNLRKSVGVPLDQGAFLIVGSPRETSQDRRDCPLLRVDAFPRRVTPEPFREIELPALANEPRPDEGFIVSEVALDVQDMIFGYLPRFGPAIQVGQIPFDEGMDGNWLVAWLVEQGNGAHGILL